MPILICRRMQFKWGLQNSKYNIEHFEHPAHYIHIPFGTKALICSTDKFVLTKINKIQKSLDFGRKSNLGSLADINVITYV